MKPAPPPPANLAKAAMWMAGTVISFSTLAVAGRFIITQLDTFEVMTYRSLISIILVVVIGALSGSLGQISTRNFGLHIIRNISHFIGQNLWFAALAMIPLAQVVALEFTSPIWVVLLAPIFLSERLTPLRMLVAVLGFSGVLIIARPDLSNLELGTLLAATAAIGFAGSAIATKRLTRSHSITCILFWLAIMQAVFGIICAGWDGEVALPSRTTLPWLILVACAGMSAHFCLTMALKQAPAVVVMPFDFARLPLAALLGMIIFNETPDIWVFVGALVIFGANFLNISVQAKQNKHHHTS